jgi:mono/diheme cytochrome c family protein
VRYLLVLCMAAACSSSGAPAGNDGAHADENFANICARCHGKDGTGGLPISPGGPKPRDLTDPAWHASVIDEQIESTIRTGKTPMPAFQTVLTNEQIRGLVGKVRRLRKGGTR